MTPGGSHTEGAPPSLTLFQRDGAGNGSQAGEPQAWPFLMLEACKNVRSLRGQFPFRKISGDGGGMVSQCECT